MIQIVVVVSVLKTERKAEQVMMITHKRIVRW